MNTLPKGLTTEDCKRILFKVGLKFGVSPKLISERLLDAQDKCDMLNDEIPIAFLEVAVKAWQDAGMPDHANGRYIPLSEDIKTGLNRPLAPAKREQDLKPSGVEYRAPFVDS